MFWQSFLSGSKEDELVVVVERRLKQREKKVARVAEIASCQPTGLPYGFTFSAKLLPLSLSSERTTIELCGYFQ